MGKPYCCRKEPLIFCFVSNKFCYVSCPKRSRTTKVFKKFDANGDGKLSATELRDVLEAVAKGEGGQECRGAMQGHRAPTAPAVIYLASLPSTERSFGWTPHLQWIWNSLTCPTSSRNHPSTDRRNAKVGNWNIPKTLHSGSAEHWQKLTMNGAGDLSQQECQQLMQGLDRDQNGNLAILPIDLKQGEGLVLVLWLLPKVSHSYDNRRVLGSSGEKCPCQRHHNCAVCYISAAVSPYRLALRDRWSLYFSIVFCSNNDLSMPRSNCLEA